MQNLVQTRRFDLFTQANFRHRQSNFLYPNWLVPTQSKPIFSTLLTRGTLYTTQISIFFSGLKRASVFCPVLRETIWA
jgi:hypothetical protein